jgi:paraquat-inducible protein B
MLGGETIVTLDIVPGAAQASLGRGGTIPELPTGPNRRDRIAEQLQPLVEKIANAPVEQIFSDMQASMAALKELTSGPELRDMLTDLRQTSAELRSMAKRLGVKSTLLIDNLGETLRSTNRLVGDRSALLADIRGVPTG